MHSRICPRMRIAMYIRSYIHTPQVGGVVEMKRELVGVVIGQERVEHRHRVWVASHSSQAVEKDGAVQVRSGAVSIQCT